MSDHKDYLLKALQLAAPQRGFCAPNPSVGAVVVKDGEVIGKGFHRGAGFAHAEVEALNEITQDVAQQCDLYITLEPCCHYGRTPPCTDLIIEKGLKAVYFGYADPNPEVAGKGAALLLAQGIACEKVDVPAINEFYRSYHYWTVSQRPWVTAKIAMSLDGKIANAGGAPCSITGKALQELTHECRCDSDAILTTINTVLHDDPQLNVRLGGGVYKKPVYVLDSKLQLPLEAQIIHASESITVFHGEKVKKGQRERLLGMGISCIQVSANKHGLLWGDILDFIGQAGCHDLWIEAGGRCFSSLLSQQELNRALIYLAPKVLGADAHSAFKEPFDLAGQGDVRWKQVGSEVVCAVDFYNASGEIIPQGIK